MGHKVVFYEVHGTGYIIYGKRIYAKPIPPTTKESKKVDDIVSD